MIIYTVKRGDTLYQIANRFGTTVDQLVYDNQIANPLRLVPGQALVIVSDNLSHRVVRGDSLYSIAQRYGTTVAALRGANPWIGSNNLIFPGQTILIPQSSRDLRGIDVNGFTISITNQTLNETLPSLSHISPFSYQVTAEGSLVPLNDTGTIAAARAASVAPMMCITNTKVGGGFSSDIAHAVLTNQAAQDAMIANIFRVLRDKNYYGLIIDFEYIFPFDRESYNQFLRRIAAELHAQGYILATALAPKISADQIGTLYEAHDYPVHGEVADLVIIMTYEWGYLYGPAMAVSPIGPVRQVLDYAVSEIPAGKIMMGMANYGYDWTLPFVQGTPAKVLTNVGAVRLASQVGAEIRYDETQQSPFFNYYDANGRRHEVWFDDARSYQARLALVDEYRLAGISFWTIDNLFRQGLLVLQDMYRINKVI